MTVQEKLQPDMKLEVVVLFVSDVHRAKAFYENLGWRLDIDIGQGDNFSGVQITPHNSEALDHLRQGSHIGQAWLGGQSGSRRG